MTVRQSETREWKLPDGMSAAKALRSLAGDWISEFDSLYGNLRIGSEGRWGIASSSGVTIPTVLLAIADLIDREISDCERGVNPEDMDWPRFEDEKPVRFGQVGLDVYGRRRRIEGVKFTQGGFVFISDGMGDTWWGNDGGPIEDPHVDTAKRVRRPLESFTDATDREKCDREALLDLERRMRKDADVLGSDYGAATHAISTYADLIREACGIFE